ncbi:hypothetical protein TVAG_055030 [Trichomonas vaginalis G3]|uniref:Uncharacterized protein n=1 Tax=Trichomonas vaginalis (strain ATCC PRA-98 / G3) TaxID=412133 RepID=A2ETH1_TRIV3|nr:hypothetical protein TVAG_055030 [Trichomonas vaginalis G3]|eukprot:XP_001316240.1 hypothetical protein [Trichomonas vaginalis G3]
MNFTLTHLSLARSSSSPFISRYSNLNIQNSLYSRFTSPLIYNAKSAFLNKVNFRQGLSSAIHVNNKDLVIPSSQSYSNTNATQENTFVVKKCVFESITNKDTQTAVIYIVSSTNEYGSLQISSSTFHNCLSRTTGAVYAKIREFGVEKSCFNGCAAYYCSFISAQTRTTGFNQINLSTITRGTIPSDTTSTKSKTLILQDGYQILQELNYSGNAHYDGVADICHVQTITTSSLRICRSTLNSNYDGSLLVILGQCGFREFYDINFLNNEVYQLIVFNYEITLSNCMFSNNNDTRIAYRYDEEGSDTYYTSISFVNCVADRKSNESPYDIILKDLKLAKNIDFVEHRMLNTYLCIGQNPKVGFIAILVIVIIVLSLAALVTYYIYYRLKHDPEISKKCSQIFLRMKSSFSKLGKKQRPEYEDGLADIQVERTLDE